MSHDSLSCVTHLQEAANQFGYGDSLGVALTANNRGSGYILSAFNSEAAPNGANDHTIQG
jgi:hypothetical protein